MRRRTPVSSSLRPSITYHAPRSLHHELPRHRLSATSATSSAPRSCAASSAIPPSFRAGSTSRLRWLAPRPQWAWCRRRPPPRSRAEARAELIDLDALHEGVNFTGHPLISLVRQLTDLCDGEAGRYVHWGATTQDVTDTGLMLQAKAAHGIILRDLRRRWPSPWPIWPAASATRSCRAAPTASTPPRSPSASRLPSGWTRSVATSSGWSRLAPHVFVGEFAGASTTLASIGDDPARGAGGAAAADGRPGAGRADHRLARRARSLRRSSAACWR